MADSNIRQPVHPIIMHHLVGIEVLHIDALIRANQKLSTIPQHTVHHSRIHTGTLG